MFGFFMFGIAKILKKTKRNVKNIKSLRFTAYGLGVYELIGILVFKAKDGDIVVWRVAIGKSLHAAVEVLNNLLLAAFHIARHLAFGPL